MKEINICNAEDFLIPPNPVCLQLPFYPLKPFCSLLFIISFLKIKTRKHSRWNTKYIQHAVITFLCSVFCCGLGAKSGGLEMKLLNYPLLLPFCRNSTWSTECEPWSAEQRIFCVINYCTFYLSVKYENPWRPPRIFPRTPINIGHISLWKQQFGLHF